MKVVDRSLFFLAAGGGDAMFSDALRILRGAQKFAAGAVRENPVITCTGNQQQEKRLGIPRNWQESNAHISTANSADNSIGAIQLANRNTSGSGVSALSGVSRIEVGHSGKAPSCDQESNDQKISREHLCSVHYEGN